MMPKPNHQASRARMKQMWFICVLSVTTCFDVLATAMQHELKVADGACLLDHDSSSFEIVSLRLAADMR